MKGKIIMAREISTSNQMKNSKPTQEEISARAYQIFVERGCPEGRDLEHWLEAEAQLRGGMQSSEKQIAPVAKAPKASTRQTASRRA